MPAGLPVPATATGWVSLSGPSPEAGPSTVGTNEELAFGEPHADDLQARVWRHPYGHVRTRTAIPPVTVVLHMFVDPPQWQRGLRRPWLVPVHGGTNLMSSPGTPNRPYVKCGAGGSTSPVVSALAPCHPRDGVEGSGGCPWRPRVLAVAEERAVVAVVLASQVVVAGSPSARTTGGGDRSHTDADKPILARRPPGTGWPGQPTR